MLVLMLSLACDMDDNDGKFAVRKDETPAVGTPAPNAADKRAAEMSTYTARLESKSGTTVAGTVTFNQDVEHKVVDVQNDQPGTNLERVPAGMDDDVKVTIFLTGATPGDHPVFVTQGNDCSGADALTAGAVMPAGMDKQGKEKDINDRQGFLGYVEVGADGLGHLEKKYDMERLGGGVMSFSDKAIVVYERKGEDGHLDTMGVRQACGVLKKDDTSRFASDAAVPAVPANTTPAR